ncbi:unnamed protein product [Peniophora sp. CBMAI 1063]|nr:unnamed protein product [Peniophora sp. CBMAI 1063]
MSSPKPLETIKSKTLQEFEKLDFARKNYTTWVTHAQDAYRIAGVHNYIYSKNIVSKPSDADQAAIWEENDGLASAYIRMRLDDNELAALRDNSSTVKTASQIWTFLENRHRKKAATQTAILDELIRTRIYRDSTMVKTANHIRSLCNQIFEIGVLTADKLATAIMMHAMQDDLGGIREFFENSATPASPKEIIERLEREGVRLKEDQKKREADAGEAAREEAHAARTADTKKASGRSRCVTCNGAHRSEDCWGPGGAMEGRRNEVQAARAKRRLERMGAAANTAASASDPKPPQASTSTAPKGKIAFLTESGQRIYLTVADDTPILATAVTSPDELNALCDQYGDSGNISDSSELSMSVLETDAVASVDWRTHCTADVDVAKLDISATAQQGFAALSLSECDAYHADTGATVHVSPIREDFYSLRPIPPKTVRGVGGSTIQALGIGEVRIRVGRGAHLILKETLYVPQATIRLMSVGRMCDDGHDAHFTSDSFNIRHIASGATIATGTRVNRRLYTLAGAISSSVKHTNRPTHTTNEPVAAAAVSLETWHKRLGHIGISAIKRMADRNMVTGTHFGAQDAGGCESDEAAGCGVCGLDRA